MSVVAQVSFTDHAASIPRALDAIGASELFPTDDLIIIKPNLVNDSPPPVTTSVAAAEAVLDYCIAHSQAEIAIGEGSGSGSTMDAFRALGYVDLARRRGVRLIDFDEEQIVCVARADALQLKEFYLPKITLDAFVISLPVLKDHSFTGTTIAMKNMFGLAATSHYSGSWKKSRLHSPSTDRSVFDVCLYKPPGLCVVDASVALTGMHLHGTPRDIGLILAGVDPVAVDAVGSRLLGHDPRDLEYLTLSNGVLGDMDDITIVEGD